MEIDLFTRLPPPYFTVSPSIYFPCFRLSKRKQVFSNLNKISYGIPSHQAYIDAKFTVIVGPYLIKINANIFEAFDTEKITPYTISKLIWPSKYVLMILLFLQMRYVKLTWYFILHLRTYGRNVGKYLPCPLDSSFSEQFLQLPLRLSCVNHSSNHCDQ